MTTVKKLTDLIERPQAVWNCFCCGGELVASKVFVLRHSNSIKYNLRPLCENCCDSILEAERWKS